MEVTQKMGEKILDLLKLTISWKLRYIKLMTPLQSHLAIDIASADRLRDTRGSRPQLPPSVIVRLLGSYCQGNIPIKIKI